MLQSPFSFNVIFVLRYSSSRHFCGFLKGADVGKFVYPCSRKDKHNGSKRKLSSRCEVWGTPWYSIDAPSAVIHAEHDQEKVSRP